MQNVCLDDMMADLELSASGLRIIALLLSYWFRHIPKSNMGISVIFKGGVYRFWLNN